MSQFLRLCTSALILVALLFSVTSSIPLSPIVCCLLVFLPVTFHLIRRSDRIFWSLFALISYFTIWTLVYSPENFLRFDFFRYDGNFFPVYLSLLVTPLLPHYFRPQKLISAFVVYVSALGLALYLVYISHGNLVPGDATLFRLLFTAHNAAGGFLATIAALAFGCFWPERRPLILICTLVLIGLILATDSRGSVLGLCAGISMVFLPKLGKRVALVLFACLQLGVAIWGWQQSDGGYTFNDIPAPTVQDDDTELVSRGHTVIQRANSWGTALSLFTRSPVFGTGFGSYDDRPYDLHGFAWLIMRNSPEEFTNSDSHAHNTYLHVLSETGLVGLSLLIIFLSCVEKEIAAIPKPEVRMALEACYWTAIFAAGTEHRLFTPSQMMPFVILLGLTLSFYRKRPAPRRFARPMLRNEIPISLQHKRRTV